VLTDAARYAALVARDPRFDGVFFVGVATTGIYCRPICPARTPGRTRCAFFASAAFAERAGYRACFRCRPELAPGHAPVDAVDTLVSRAAQRIGEGALNTRSIEDLAATFGVSARHLRRAMEARLGVSPIELAQSRRLALAKQLLQDTALPLADIAFAAGFGSVRRFNAVFARRMGAPPSALRRRHVAEHETGGDLALRLEHRAPYDWPHLLAFLRGRAIPGVELVEGDRYRRVVHLDGHIGEIVVARGSRASGRDALSLVVSPSLLPVLMPLVARVRRMFDLDADPAAIERVLGRDRLLGPLVRTAPGVRVPGAIDPFEASVRALLGQQVSVAAATTLAGRFAAALGAPYAGQGLTTRFPTVAEVIRAGAVRIARLGLPRTRAEAIHNFACVIERGDIVLDAACDRKVRLCGPAQHSRKECAGDLEAFVAQLVELPGIGPWTAHYLAMRALHVPDAFPASDLGVQKALRRSGPRAASIRAERWRPYRAYAVMHLWRSLGGV
jgi:AraC family transcriptional regulator, regulatory protein of adaptative response / DNA-3-methyladenine glycosylase II